MTAEELHLVDVGGLEADHGRCRHAEDRREKLPMEAGNRDDVSEIKRDADRAQHRKIDDANRAGDHDRRIGPADFLIADGEGGGSEPAASFELRTSSDAVHRGRCRGVKHRACVNWFHWSTSVLEHAHRNMHAGAEFPTPPAYGTNRKKQLRW
jgi:hypothetical protein